MRCITRSINAPKKQRNKTEMKTQYTYQNQTINAASSVPQGTVAAQSHNLGMERHEPLIVALDSMIRYARAYESHFERQLSEDYILGEEWLSVVKGIRGLLNGNGVVAMELGRAVDSKDNGACETMFWDALKVAGYTEETANL